MQKLIVYFLLIYSSEYPTKNYIFFRINCMQNKIKKLKRTALFSLNLENWFWILFLTDSCDFFVFGNLEMVGKRLNCSIAVDDCSEMN